MYLFIICPLIVDEKKRPGVPFRATQCCGFGERSMFEEESEKRETGSNLLPVTIECHPTTGKHNDFVSV